MTHRYVVFMLMDLNSYVDREHFVSGFWVDDGIGFKKSFNSYTFVWLSLLSHKITPIYPCTSLFTGRELQIKPKLHFGVKSLHTYVGRSQSIDTLGCNLHSGYDSDGIRLTYLMLLQLWNFNDQIEKRVFSHLPRNHRRCLENFQKFHQDQFLISKRRIDTDFHRRFIRILLANEIFRLSIEGKIGITFITLKPTDKVLITQRNKINAFWLWIEKNLFS